MNALTEKQLRFRIKLWIVFFISGLVLSGVTAFPIEAQLNFLVQHVSFLPTLLQSWLLQIYFAVHLTNAHFPYLSYGTDWLAFSHLVIATAFIGPMRDPVRNIWVIQFGMIACLMVFPLALIAGPVRGIPLFWQLIDCSFGAIGIVPLSICYRYIKQLEKMTDQLSIVNKR